MFRIALMMFNLLIRQEVRRIVRYVIKTPAVKAVNSDSGEIVKLLRTRDSLTPEKNDVNMFPIA